MDFDENFNALSDDDRVILSEACTQVLGIMCLFYLFGRMSTHMFKAISSFFRFIIRKCRFCKHRMDKIKMTKPMQLIIAILLMSIGGAIDTLIGSMNIESPSPFSVHPVDPTHIMSPFHFTIPRSGLNPSASKEMELEFSDSTNEESILFGYPLMIERGGMNTSYTVFNAQGDVNEVIGAINEYIDTGRHQSLYFRCAEGQLWIQPIGEWPRCVDIHVE